MESKKALNRMIVLFFVLAFALAGCGIDKEDEESCKVINDGGIPAIWFTYVPPYGSYDNLKGSVSNMLPENYSVAVYIKVGGWWTKPYWSRPKTYIDKCGNFKTDITTGGIDETATEIRAYLILDSYDPPLAYGNSLTAEIEDNAVALAVAKR